MKKFILSILLLGSLRSFSQVVFCPPGAEWRYAFKGFGPPSDPLNIYKIKYERDSVLGQQGVVKVLSHNRFFTDGCGYNVSQTLLLSKNNKVYFRNNATHNNWQILYDFNCIAGQSWATKIYPDATSSASETYTFSVDSVSTVYINNISLKRLYVGAYIITERLGCNYFFFPFNSASSAWCDGDYPRAYVCYRDEDIGIYSNPNIPCDFMASVPEYRDNQNIEIFPCPFADQFKIDLSSTHFAGWGRLKIINILGETIISREHIETALPIDIEFKKYAPGNYLIQLFDDQKLIAYRKIIKEQ